MSEGRRQRIVVGVALLALAAAGAVALVALQQAAQADGLAEAGTGEVRVSIVGRDGETLWNGTVRVENATGLTALAEAARVGGFTYRVRDYGGMGAYVEEIAGQEASGPEGWKYWTLEDGRFVEGDRSSEFAPLQDGGWVHWRWAASDTREPW